MKATDVLRADHTELRELIGAVRATRAGDRRAAFKALKARFEAHARLEEDVFYPAVRRVRSHAAKEAVRQALEEHHLVDGHLADLDQTDVEDPRFDAGFDRLELAVVRHVEAEEAQVFAHALNNLSDERLERLGLELEGRRAARAANPTRS